MFDKLINRIGISLTLLFVIIELAWINSKSLLFLTNSSLLIDEVFCIIGAVAYSLVTVTVMRKSKSLVMRIIFPAFDIAFVFLGFNINQGGLISSDPVRFYLSVIVALFTGVIIFSLGLINAKDHIPDIGKMVDQIPDLRKTISEYEESYLSLMRDYESLQTKCSVFESDNTILKSECEQLRGDKSDIACDLLSHKEDIKLLRSQVKEYYPIYIRAEASRIRKKDRANYTDTDVGIIAECDRLFPKAVNVN